MKSLDGWRCLGLVLLLSGCEFHVETKWTIVDSVEVRASETEAWDAVSAAIEGAGGKLERGGGNRSESSFEFDGKTLVVKSRPASQAGSIYVSVSENEEDGDAELQAALHCIREEMQRRGLVVATPDSSPGQGK